MEDDLLKPVSRKTGDEHFHAGGQLLPFDVLSFWRWSSSDLVNNAMRGVLAEYLVACAVGVEDGVRVQWDAYDLVTPSGVKVEVKSAAYIQSWSQSAASQIRFDIRSTRGWDARTNTTSILAKRQADVYVFALLHHRDRTSLDPLDIEQWTFYVLSSTILDERVPHQKSIGLVMLGQLGAVAVDWNDIKSAIERVR